MYRRYNSNSPPRGGGSSAPQANLRDPSRGAQGRGAEPPRTGNAQAKNSDRAKREPERAAVPPHADRPSESGFLDSLLDILPSELYNRRTKKILGLVTAEDLLLLALILLVADSDDADKALIFALLYILAG